VSTFKIKSVLNVLSSLNLKTIVFNFHYFKFKDAIRFPVFIDRKVVFNNLKGTVELKGIVSPGVVRIGCGELGILDNKNTASIWDVSGKIYLYDSITISRGACISVGDKGMLTLSRNVIISYTARIICHKEIVFGENSMISWDSYVIDTDFHPIFDSDNKRINDNKSIIIGKNVWIGFNCVVLKGANIADHTIIGANTSIGKNSFKGNSIIIGNPPISVKDNIYWSFK
jgi:hypothetical protein